MRAFSRNLRLMSLALKVKGIRTVDEFFYNLFVELKRVTQGFLLGPILFLIYVNYIS